MKNLILFFVYAALFTFPEPSWGRNPFPMGWKSSKHGIRAASLETHPLFKVAPLPQSSSVAKWYFRTNQKDRGACVAFSAWEAYAAVHAKNNKGARLDLSALDIYQMCLVYDRSFPDDEGTYGTTAIAVLTKNGTLLERTWPYSMPLNMLAPVNEYTKSERLKHFAVKAYAVSGNDGGFAVKQCIANLRIGVMVGSLWYNNGFSTSFVKCQTKMFGRPTTINRYVLPYPKGMPVGGHEVVIVAYDDNMVFPDGSVGGVEIHNHWEGFGDDRGSAWAPYRWFFNPRIAEDKVAIETVNKLKP